jgi:hypothetical protein
VELGHSASHIGILIHNIGIIARFGCFNSGSQSAYAAADDQDTLGFCICHVRPPPLIDHSGYFADYGIKSLEMIAVLSRLTVSSMN